MMTKAVLYCEHVRGLRLRMESAKAAYEQALAAVDGVKAVRYDKIGSTAAAHGDDATAALIERLDASGTAMAEAIAEWARECEEFDGLCRSLAPQSAYVLSMRYRNGARWGEIADRLRYSAAYVRGELRARALLELYEFIPLAWK